MTYVNPREEDPKLDRSSGTHATTQPRQPVLLEQLPHVGGSDGPASPSQCPPDTRTTSGTAGLAATGASQAWEDSRAPRSPSFNGAQTLPARIPASQCCGVKQDLPQDDKPALRDAKAEKHQSFNAPRFISRTACITSSCQGCFPAFQQPPRPKASPHKSQDAPTWLMAARCRLREPLVPAPSTSHLKKKREQVINYKLSC